MNLFRTIEAVDDGYYCVGDIIQYSLNDGEAVEALAVKGEQDSMVFVMVDCLRRLYRMHHSLCNCEGYDSSDLRKELNTEIIKRFPTDILEKIVPFENGDLLRIPSKEELFGSSYNYNNELDDAQQWDSMKNRRNRIAFQGSKTGIMLWYWLQNNAKDAILSFETVNVNGYVDRASACTHNGLRPVFKLKDGKGE